jgi:hypothetical protein
VPAKPDPPNAVEVTTHEVVPPFTPVDLPTADATDAATLTTAFIILFAFFILFYFIVRSLETISSDPSGFIGWEGLVAWLDEALCWLCRPSSTWLSVWLLTSQTWTVMEILVRRPGCTYWPGG